MNEPTKRQRIDAWLKAENERALVAKVTARLKPAPVGSIYTSPAAAKVWASAVSAQFKKPSYFGTLTDFGVIKMGSTT